MRIVSMDLGRPTFTWLHWESETKVFSGGNVHGRSCSPLPVAGRRSAGLGPAQEPTYSLVVHEQDGGATDPSAVCEALIVSPTRTISSMPRRSPKP
jgi:hypothetical protein